MVSMWDGVLTGCGRELTQEKITSLELETISSIIIREAAPSKVIRHIERQETMSKRTKKAVDNYRTNICQRRKPSEVSLAFGGAFPQTEMPVDSSISNCVSVLLSVPERLRRGVELCTGTDSQRSEAAAWGPHPGGMCFLLQPIMSPGSQPRAQGI